MTEKGPRSCTSLGVSTDTAPKADSTVKAVSYTHLRESVALPLNLEMGNTPEMVDFALRLKPDYVCMLSLIHI